MVSRKLCLLSLLTVASLAVPAYSRADVIFEIGNNPQLDENVLMNSGLTGNPVFGFTNVSNTQVDFASDEDLTQPANGQARIEGADGLFSTLTITSPGNTFSSIIFNLNAAANGFVTFSGVDDGGNPFEFADIAVGGSGQNFMTFTTANNQGIASLTITGLDETEFEDIRQVRVGITGVDIPDVPEPASLALWLTAMGGVALASRRRRR